MDRRLLTTLIIVLAILLVVAFAMPPFAVVLGLAVVAVAVIMSVWDALKRQRAARRWAAISSYYTLTPEQFEQHVAQLFEYQGYSTMLTPRTGDQGVDVIARKGEQVIAIQCKRYADPAPNTAVQAVHSGSKYYGCSEAALVCLGGFSRAATELAGAVSVKLIDGNAYADMVHALTNGNGAPAITTLPSAKVLGLATLALLVGAALVSYGLTTHPASAAATTATASTASSGSVATAIIIFALLLIALVERAKEAPPEAPPLVERHAYGLCAKALAKRENPAWLTKWLTTADPQ